MDFRRLSPRDLRVLVPVAALTLGSFFYVEEGLRIVPSPWFDDMLRASETSLAAARAVKRHRLERGAFVDAVNDPAETALIGQEYTQITTDRGYLEAKLVSTNPNFAAVVVDMLRELEIDRGDCVAVAMTGSLPALNLSTLAALETLETRPVLISSVGASNYGATDPYFTWLDMEALVAEQGILATRSQAASLGGGNDTGRGLSPKGRELLRAAIERNGIVLLAEERLEASILERVRIYRDHCAPESIAAYVNVGGGVASLGHSVNAELLPLGASRFLPPRNFPMRGALLRLAADGVPVVQLSHVRRLRDRYGLGSVDDSLPPPGQGRVYGALRYSLPRTAFSTFLVLSILTAIYLWDRHVHRLGRPDPEGETR